MAKLSEGTKVEQQLAAAQTRFAGDPVRADLIARTRHFKAGWIELAEVLTAAQKDHRHTQWGYASFEEYYRKELFLKTATVNKLVGTFAYLRKTSPQTLQRDGVTQQFPSLAAIEFVRRADEAKAGGQIPGELFDEVRRACIDDTLPIAQVTKQFGAAVFPKDEEIEQSKRKRAALRLVGKLSVHLDDLAPAGTAAPDLRLAIDQVREALSKLLSAVGDEAAAMEPTDEPAQAAA